MTVSTAEALATKLDWDQWADRAFTQLERKGSFHAKKRQRRLVYQCENAADQLTAYRFGFDLGAEWRLTAPPEQLERLIDLCESIDVRGDFDDEYSHVDLAAEILGDDADDEDAANFWSQFDGAEHFVAHYKFAWGFCEASTAKGE